MESADKNIGEYRESANDLYNQGNSRVNDVRISGVPSLPEETSRVSNKIADSRHSNPIFNSNISDAVRDEGEMDFGLAVKKFDMHVSVMD